MNSARAISAELLGSLMLAAVVVGSGIMAQRLSPGDMGLQLLMNAFATALGLGVLIVVFQPISGAHLNPVVTIADAILDRERRRLALPYVGAQTLGGIAGVLLANAMFALPAASWSTTERATASTVLSEVVATAGLVLVVFVLARTERARLAPVAVGAYIGAAYFFTASTSFANPAITIGRMFSDTFAGVAPTSAPAFVAAQVVGAAAGLAIAAWLTPARAAGSLRDPARPIGPADDESAVLSDDACDRGA